MRKSITTLVLLALLACAQSSAVSQQDWQRMSKDEKVLYVSSLMGMERVKDAKGRKGKKYPDAAEEYVARIDDAYTRGDERAPEEIFAGMGTE